MIMRKLAPALMMLALVACSGPKTKPLTGNSLKSTKTYCCKHLG